MAYVTDQELRVRDVESQERIAEAQEKIATALTVLAQSSLRFMEIVELEVEEEKKYQNSLKR